MPYITVDCWPALAFSPMSKLNRSCDECPLRDQGVSVGPLIVMGTGTFEIGKWPGSAMATTVQWRKPTLLHLRKSQKCGQLTD